MDRIMTYIDVVYAVKDKWKNVYLLLLITHIGYKNINQTFKG